MISKMAVMAVLAGILFLLVILTVVLSRMGQEGLAMATGCIAGLSGLGIANQAMSIKDGSER